MKYQVLDCDLPADCYSHNVHKSWNNSVFDTPEEANEYANKWLGIYGPIELKVDEPYYYDDHIYIIIEEVEE
jgi:hypothetical protein